MTLYYAGIGSRKAPPDAMKLMEDLGFQLAKKGLILRSGGADGADTAFERGCVLANGTKEIFLPWKGFNKNLSPHYDVPDQAFTVAQKFHPRWQVLSPAAKKLMARNVQQICGKNLDSPTDFVICWTPDGCISNTTRTRETGGTGQAIPIASELEIPVINLNHPKVDIALEIIYTRIGLER